MELEEGMQPLGPSVELHMEPRSAALIEGTASECSRWGLPWGPLTGPRNAVLGGGTREPHA
eukprot:2026901-Pyramimonas_sp.AAC.1